MEENKEKVLEKVVVLEGEPKKDDFFIKQQLINWWSWSGSFLTTWTFIVAKNWWMLIVYLITFIIPFINFIAWIFWFIYGWLKWKEIIYKSPRFENHDQRIWAIKAMEAYGFVVFILMIAWIIFYAILWALFIWTFLSMLGK